MKKSYVITIILLIGLAIWIMWVNPLNQKGNIAPSYVMPTPLPIASPTATPSGEVKRAVTMVAPVLAKDVFNRVNGFRASQGLPAFTMSKRTCNFAYTRDQEIVKDFSHNGFYSRSARSAMPYAGQATENLGRADQPGFDVVMGWENSPTHRANLLANTPEACIMMYTAPNGKIYYAMEGLHAN